MAEDCSSRHSNGAQRRARLLGVTRGGLNAGRRTARSAPTTKRTSSQSTAPPPPPPVDGAVTVRLAVAPALLPPAGAVMSAFAPTEAVYVPGVVLSTGTVMVQLP